MIFCPQNCKLMLGASSLENCTVLVSMSYNCVKEGFGVLRSFFLFKVRSHAEIVYASSLFQPKWLGQAYISALLASAHLDFVNLWPSMSLVNRTGLGLFIPDIPSEWFIWPLWKRVLLTARMAFTFILTMDMIPSLVISFVRSNANCMSI